MALPTTVLAAAGLGGHHPPYKSSGGAFYAVVRTDADELDVYKATDPTDSWSVQGTNPVHAGTILGFSTVQDGDVIHMVAWSSAAYEYYTFNMATDAWVVDQAIETPTNAPTFPWASIAVRSDGDVVVVYAGDTDRNMGDTKERVDVNVRTSGSWGGPVALDAGGDVHYGNPNCVLGTNDFVHCVWQTQISTADDPPTGWVDGEGRTLNSSDTLSTVSTLSDADSDLTMTGMAHALSYDDAGTQRIIVMAVAFSFSPNKSPRKHVLATEDGSDNISLDSVDIEALSDNRQGYGSSTLENAILSGIELNGDLHQLYSGGDLRGEDQDLYYTKSTDDGATWDTPTEEIDGITVNYISANIYSNAAPTDTGWVFPGTMVGNRTIAGSDTDWSNVDNCKADDSSEAETTSALGENESSSGLAASNFNFSIPVGSFITGIEIRFEDVSAPDHSGGGHIFTTIKLILADDSDGSVTETSPSIVATPQTFDFGGQLDLWSELIGRDDVVNSNFGFFCGSTNNTTFVSKTQIDSMQMKVYYSPPPIVMAYVYDDGGVQKYNEKVLIAGVKMNPGFLLQHKIGARYY